MNGQCLGSCSTASSKKSAFISADLIEEMQRFNRFLNELSFVDLDADLRRRTSRFKQVIRRHLKLGGVK